MHFSNLPENLAFFSGAIDAAGSFGGIYQSAIYAYGNQLIKDPVDASASSISQHLQALEAAGAFADQKVAIAPIRTGGAGAGRKRSAAEQRHPLSLRAELARTSTSTTRRT